MKQLLSPIITCSEHGEISSANTLISVNSQLEIVASKVRIHISLYYIFRLLMLHEFPFPVLAFFVMSRYDQVELRSCKQYYDCLATLTPIPQEFHSFFCTMNHLWFQLIKILRSLLASHLKTWEFVDLDLGSWLAIKSCLKILCLEQRILKKKKRYQHYRTNTTVHRFKGVFSAVHIDLNRLQCLLLTALLSDLMDYAPL